MPTDNDRDIQNTNDSPHDAPAPVANTPTFSLEDVRTIVRETVAATIPQPQSPRRVAPVEPTPEAPTEEDLNSNLGGAIKKQIEFSLHPLKQEMNMFRQFGLEKLGTLTREVVATKMPYYKDFKGEIDAEVGKLDPALQTDEQCLQIVHDRVVMRHLPEITNRIADETRRQTRAEAPAPTSVTGRNVDKDGKPLPQPADLFSAEQCDEIARLGGPDAFARRITDGRCDDWKAYVERHNTFSEARQVKGSGLRGRVMLFPKLKLKAGGIVGG